MRPGPIGGASRAGARGGIAPALLLDVQTPAGDIFYWSDRALKQIPAVITADGSPANVEYSAWLLASGTFSYNRSLVSDTGSITVQSTSGDVLQRDFERIVRRGVLEGSFFVFRYYSVDMEWAWIEQHGTLTVGDTTNTAQLGLQQLFAGSDDTPVMSYGETCNLVWGEARCGATKAGHSECLYTYASCQVTNRFVGIQTAFELNNPETVAALPAQPPNRKRPW